jgi:hypothetical protein
LCLCTAGGREGGNLNSAFYVDGSIDMADDHLTLAGRATATVEPTGKTTLTPDATETELDVSYPFLYTNNLIYWSSE